MPFGTISSQSISYEPRKPGTYQKSGLALGAPTDEFRLTGANPSTGRKDLTCAVTRVLQKDVTVGSDTVRKNCVVTCNITVPNDGSFTGTEIDSLVTDINTFVTSANLQRQLSGEI